VTVERVSPDDLMQRALDVGPLPMHVGAVLVLGSAVDLDRARQGLGERIGAVPRMRQRLVRTPLGCGGPIWVDDVTFDLSRHVTALGCPSPGDEAALLEVAVQSYTRELPMDRPLWRATLVTGLAEGRSALVLVVHHMLADGFGGLAMLSGLADGSPTIARPFPRPRPSRRALAADAWRSRLSGLRRSLAALGTLRPAARELGGAPRAAACSLNRRLHPRLRVVLVRADLARVLAAARSRGGTLNDAVLAAVGGALGNLLELRGEDVRHLVISVPVTGGSPDASAPDARVVNRVGVMPVAVPVAGPRRLERIAEITRARKSAARGSSSALTRPAFRMLAAIGALPWLIRRQRMVNTFVTNVRGPERRLALLRAEVTDIIPLGTVSGNVTVAFTVLSYAGTMTVAIAADPVACPDVDGLRALLQGELDDLVGRDGDTPVERGA
jgi:WS/DGAT/MGAT family acyltransferase